MQNPGDPIVLPTKLKSTQVDYECELAVVIGKTCKNATKENALDYVLGYTCGNDVSARDWQKDFGGGQWCRGKTFDTFAPLGPCLVTKDEIPNPNALKIKTILNGQAMQDWTTEDMIFDVRTLIDFLSGSTTLLAGHRDHDRHAARRRRRPQAAGVPESRRHDHDRDREDRAADESGGG